MKVKCEVWDEDHVSHVEVDQYLAAAAAALSVGGRREPKCNRSTERGNKQRRKFLSAASTRNIIFYVHIQISIASWLLIDEVRKKHL